jgi:hypothetical protein
VQYALHFSIGTHKTPPSLFELPDGQHPCSISSFGPTTDRICYVCSLDRTADGACKHRALMPQLIQQGPLLTNHINRTEPPSGNCSRSCCSSQQLRYCCVESMARYVAAMDAQQQAVPVLDTALHAAGRPASSNNAPSNSAPAQAVLGLAQHPATPGPVLRQNSISRRLHYFGLSSSVDAKSVRSLIIGRLAR